MISDSNLPGFADGSLYDDIDYQKTVSRGLYLGFNAKAKHQADQEKRNQLILSTPDSRFPLSTPEVEAFITTVGKSTATISTITTTPTPTRFFRPGGSVTAEQEMYAQGFLEALDQLHQRSEPGAKNANEVVASGSVIHHAHAHSTAGHGVREAQYVSTALTGPNPSLASVAPTYVTATMDYIPNIPVSCSQSERSAYPIVSSAPHIHAHDAYQVSNSYPVMNAYATNPHHSVEVAGYSGYSSGHSSFSGVNPDLLRELQAVVPADMKTQEQLKVDRKKARNRIAASKCRVRRLQRESDLTGKVKMLKEHNQELNNEVNGLKEQIYSLKKALLQHMKTGCQVNMPEGFRAELDSISSE